MLNWGILKEPLNWLLVLVVIAMLIFIGHIFRDRSLDKEDN